MSKSLGNVVNPKDLVEEFGVEVVRYYIARHFNNFEDSDFSLDKFKEAYNANLANGLGNLVSRIMKMATTYGVTIKSDDKDLVYFTEGVTIPELEAFDINTFMDNIWINIGHLDEYIQSNEPFKKIKTDPEEAKKDVEYLLLHLLGVSLALEPIMPETSKKIRRLILDNEMPTEPLFLRQD
jgi:methionyl-tRNA synthetase